MHAVTNLRDAGPSSLRAAVEASGPRTVVFRVSGTIDLESPLRIRNPYITIAGQTAPGDGIAIKDHPLVIEADEVIVRYLRVRVGDQTDSDVDAISARYVKNLEAEPRTNRSSPGVLSLHLRNRSNEAARTETLGEAVCTEPRPRTPPGRGQRRPRPIRSHRPPHGPGPRAGRRRVQRRRAAARPLREDRARRPSGNGWCICAALCPPARGRETFPNREERECTTM